VVVHFIDIGGIVDHYCVNFLVIILPGLILISPFGLLNPKDLFDIICLSNLLNRSVVDEVILETSRAH
jgi:hypothetical protein